MRCKLVTLLVSNYFDIRKIAESGQCFRVNRLYGSTYSVVAFGHYIEISQDYQSNEVRISCSEEEYEELWKPYFDIQTNYDKLEAKTFERFSDDAFLLNSMNYGRGIRILNQDFFETLISFIISQRKSIPSIKRCVEKLSMNYGEVIKGVSLSGEIVNAHAFPAPNVLAQVDPESLRASCGVGYRAEYIIDAANWYLSKGSRYALCDLGYQTSCNIMQSEIFGVGKKIANCVCLFGLHQLEACPIDVWMQRIIDEDYRESIPKWMDDEYAGVLQQYCFYYKRDFR